MNDSNNDNNRLTAQEDTKNVNPNDEIDRYSDDSDRGSDGEMGPIAGDPHTSRREKRLYMNRESARARRKRKKALMESLEQQVAELSKRNQMYRLLNESLTTQVQQLESDLAVANATIVMLRSGGGVNSAVSGSSPIYAGGGAPNSSNDSINRILASQSRNVFTNSLSAAASELGLVSGGHDVLLQRQRELQSQLSQVNIDSVLANFLQQQQQQQQQLPSLALSPRLNQQAALNQETLASAVELGRLRAVQRGDHLAGSSTDYSNFEDPRKAAIEAILKYHQHQDRSKHGNR